MYRTSCKQGVNEEAWNGYELGAACALATFLYVRAGLMLCGLLALLKLCTDCGEVGRDMIRRPVLLTNHPCKYDVHHDLLQNSLEGCKRAEQTRVNCIYMYLWRSSLAMYYGRTDTLSTE